MVRERVFAQRRLSVGAAAFVDVTGSDVLPIDCNYIIVFNDTGVSIALRSDPTNANSEITIATGQQFEVGCSRWTDRGIGCRFPANGGDAPCALKSSSGTVSPLIISIN